MTLTDTELPAILGGGAVRTELECGCAWTPQPDVDYRPTLEEPVGERHLARWVRGQVAAWEVVTWCDRTVPADHRCPTEAELRALGVSVPTFCSACARAWEARKRLGESIRPARAP